MDDIDLSGVTAERWAGVFAELGLDSSLYQGKTQVPCPFCGGKTRFRWLAREYPFVFACNQCENRTPFQCLVELGFSKGKIFDKINNVSEVRVATNKVDYVAQRRAVLGSLHSCKELTDVSPAAVYLKMRGIPLSVALSAKNIYSTNKYVSPWIMSPMPSLVQKIYSGGKVCSFHVTVLDSSMEKNYREKKWTKNIAPLSGNGAYVPLFDLNDTGMLAIAEGLEKSLAVKAKLDKDFSQDVPVWNVLDTDNMRKFKVPEGVNTLLIYSDGDGNFAGQAASYALANKIKIHKDTSFIDVSVSVPPLGRDWDEI